VWYISRALGFGATRGRAPPCGAKRSARRQCCARRPLRSSLSAWAAVRRVPRLTRLWRACPALATFRDHRRRQEGHSDQRDRRPVQHRHAQANRVLSRARCLSGVRPTTPAIVAIRRCDLAREATGSREPDLAQASASYERERERERERLERHDTYKASARLTSPWDERILATGEEGGVR
jgi:hypothetical protein